MSEELQYRKSIDFMTQNSIVENNYDDYYDFDHIVYRQVAVGSMAGTVCINPVNDLFSYTVMPQESNIEEPSHTMQIPMVKLVRN